MALYAMIANTRAEIPAQPRVSDQLKNFLGCLLESDPKRRITMQDAKVHPWITDNGKDPMPSTRDNAVEVKVEPGDIKHALSTRTLRSIVRATPKLRRMAGEARERVASATSSEAPSPPTESARVKNTGSKPSAVASPPMLFNVRR
jgi:[calcium/calmodulin-dependent protein kinase] kinase